jgi:AcrR family transcriptional regulator
MASTTRTTSARKRDDPNTSVRPSRTVPYGQGRDALCAALVRVVAAKGLDGVTFRSVAAEAGVTHGLASYYFTTRENMVSEALKWAAERAVDILESAPADDDGRFAGYLPDHVRKAEAEAVFQFYLALESLSRPDLRQEVQASYNRYVESTQDYLERLGLPHDSDLARLVFAAKDGLVLQQLIYGSTEVIERGLDRLAKLLRDGAAST